MAALAATSAQGMIRIQLERDSSNLVNALKTRAFDQSLAGIFLMEARHLIELDFVFVEVSFTPCSCNMCAHELACSSLSWDPNQSYVWLDPSAIL
jgi:hypothetical protein